MTQPPIFNIQMVGPGIEIVLQALNEVPLPQRLVRPLYDEIAGQYAYQMQQQEADAEEADTQHEETN
ncbi:MAG: hypothetical protein ACO3CJ_09985 [Burkholderiaceae bacterium]